MNKEIGEKKIGFHHEVSRSKGESTFEELIGWVKSNKPRVIIHDKGGIHLYFEFDWNGKTSYSHRDMFTYFDKEKSRWILSYHKQRSIQELWQICLDLVNSQD